MGSVLVVIFKAAGAADAAAGAKAISTMAASKGNAPGSAMRQIAAFEAREMRVRLDIRFLLLVCAASAMASFRVVPPASLVRRAAASDSPLEA